MRHRSQTSRADLLRLLESNPTDSAQALAAPLFGYALPAPMPQPLTDQSGQTTETSATESTPVPAIPESAAGKPAPEFFYVLQTRREYATLESLNSDLPPALQGVDALGDDELQPFEPGAPIPWQPILPAHRQAEFLRQTLTDSTGLRLDIPKLIKQAARLKMPARMPKKPRVSPAGRVVVLLDLNRRMRPFWQDAQHLCEAIERKHGHTGLEIRVMDDNPQGEYWDWFDGKRRMQPWRPLHAQSVVFIISDLGQLTGEESLISSHWLRLLRQCRRQGISPVVLAPIAAAQQDPALQSAVRQCLWSKHGRMRPQRRAADWDAHKQAVRRVLGLLSVATHVEPELLRAILACLPAEQADSGIEAAVWLHEDVDWGYTALRLKADKRTGYQQDYFKNEPAELQQQVLTLLKAHHIGQFPAVWAEELLNAKPLVNFDLTSLEEVGRAEDFMRRLTRRLHANEADNGIRLYARRHLERLGEESRRASDYASALFGLVNKAEIRQGAKIPRDYDADIVHIVTGERISPQRYYLLQQGEQLIITPQHGSHNGLQTGVLLAEFTASLDNVTIEGEDTNQLSLNGSAAPALSIPLTGKDLTIVTGLEKLYIAAIPKPNWAHAIAQTPRGIKAYLFFAGRNFPLTWRANTSLLSGQIELGRWLPDAINAEYDFSGGQNGIGSVGFDHIGLYGDLNLIFGGAQQRFRWIEPGTFEMGSPENETQREWGGHEKSKDTETLHTVTLTQGFWLADTTVSQAFWQAVMGDNPSRFKDNPNNPVEQVSWDDAQLFIGKLNAMFPGLAAMLPSEAQWEYACRAGTKTPFSFGFNIPPEHVNYNGEYPYADGEKGLFRERTVPVKSLPANAWGLYEMHGNVWEWCADVWRRRMTAEPVTDPINTATEGGSARVVRGGSWVSGGRDVRSAFRSRGAPDVRYDYLGFRLALGHAELKFGQSGGAAKPEVEERSDWVKKFKKLFGNKAGWKK